MAPQQQPGPDYYAYDRRVAAQAQASAEWARTFKLLLILLAVAGLIWVLWYAFGTPGLQFGLIAAFVIAVVLGVWMLMMSMHGRTADVVTETVQNLVAFQRADDQGEVARAAIAALSNGQRGNTQLDSRILQLAGVIGRAQAQGQIAAHRAASTIDAQRQQWEQQQTQQQQREAFYGYASDTVSPNSDFHVHQ